MRNFLFLFLWMVVVAFAEEPVYYIDESQQVNSQQEYPQQVYLVPVYSQPVYSQPVYPQQAYSAQSYSQVDPQRSSKWTGRSSFYSASYIGLDYLKLEDDAGELSGPFMHGTYSGGGFVFNVKGGFLVKGLAGPFAAFDFSYHDGKLEKDAAKISDMELDRLALSAGIIGYPFRGFDNFWRGLFIAISVGVEEVWFTGDDVDVSYYDYSDDNLDGVLWSFELGEDFNICGRFNMGFALVYSIGITSESENRTYEDGSAMTGYNSIGLVFHVARI